MTSDQPDKLPLNHPDRVWRKPGGLRRLVLSTLVAAAIFLIIYWRLSSTSAGWLEHIIAGVFAASIGAWVLLDLMNKRLHPECQYGPTPGCQACRWRLMSQIALGLSSLMWLIL